MFPVNVKGMRTAIGEESKVFFEENGGYPSVVFHIKCPDTGRIFTFQFAGRSSNILHTLRVQFDGLIEKIERDGVGVSSLENPAGCRLEIIKEKGKIVKARIHTPEGTSPDVTFIHGSLDIMARRVMALGKMMTQYLVFGDLTSLDMEFTVYHELQHHFNVVNDDYQITMCQDDGGLVRSIKTDKNEMHIRVDISSIEDLGKLIGRRTEIVSGMFHIWSTDQSGKRWFSGDEMVNGYRDSNGKLHLCVIDVSVINPSNLVMLPADGQVATDFVKSIKAEIAVLSDRFFNQGVDLSSLKGECTRFKRISDLFVERMKLGRELTHEASKRMECYTSGPIWELIPAVEGLRVYQGHLIRGRVKTID